MKLIIPIEPPSGNHYIKHTRSGRHYLTVEAKSWYQAIAVIAAGETVAGKAYEVTYTVFMGANKKMDVDNFSKVILDGLVKAGVIKSDAKVTSLHCHKQRDRDNPRTEITVEAI